MELRNLCAPLRRRAVLCALSAGLLLAACGGGGGNGNETPPAQSAPAGSRLPPATERLDENPTGARLQTGGDNYFPFVAGNEWTYERTETGSAAAPTTVTVRITAAGVPGTVGWQETEAGASGTIHYRRTAQGLEVVGPYTGGMPAAAAQLVGDPLEFAEPFYAVGSVRRLLRRGSYGEDFDGDGISEGLTFELVQTVVGFEGIPVGARTLSAMHLRTVYRITATYSRSIDGRFPPDYVFTATEDTWWAAGVGMVRAERRSEDSTRGVLERPYVLRLTAGTVAGLAVVDPGYSSRAVALSHTALLYDRHRNVFYASVPGHVAGAGNRIATIDPASGQFTLSAPVGSEPAAMALAADGASLYVGLGGSGELLRLALPAMNEQSRVRMPHSVFYGQLVVDEIAASPVDADTVAVALARTSVSPRHGGVALVHQMQVLSRTTPEHTGSNLVVFGADGTQLYGYNTESTEFGLRRIEVLPDGLAEVQVLRDFVGYFYQRAIDRSGSQVLVGNRVASVPGLGRAGEFSQAQYCRFLATPRVACLDTEIGAAERTVRLYDPNTFAFADSLPLPRSIGTGNALALVPGAAGMLAVRHGIEHPARREASGILFLSGDRLR